MATVTLPIGALLIFSGLAGGQTTVSCSESRPCGNCSGASVSVALNSASLQIPSLIHVAAAQDTAAQRRLIEDAVKRFVPWLRDSTAKQGTLFVVIDAEGQLLQAVFGSLEDFERAKAKIEDFDLRVGSMSIVNFPAGVILPRRLNAAIVEMK